MSSNTNQQGITILIVGTTATDCWLQSRLKACGYRFHTAANIKSAFAQLKTKDAELILLLSSAAAGSTGEDVQAMCQQFKHRPSTCHIPIVVMAAPTGDNPQAAQTAAFTAGAADYIVLPVADELGRSPEAAAVEALMARIEQHVAIVQLRRDAARAPAAAAQHIRRGLAEPQAPQLQQTLNFSQFLKRVLHRIQAAKDEAQVLQVAVDELCAALNLAGGVAAIRTPGAPVIHVSAICEQYRHHPQALSVEQAAVAATAPLRQLWIDLRLGEAGSLQFCYSHPQWGRQAGLACTIADAQGVIGDLRLSRPAARSLSSEECCLAQHVADYCAIAVRQVRLYKTAQEQVELLEGLQRQKDDFLSTVSHELRSPVTNMKMAIQMLTMSLDRLEQPPVGEPGRMAVATPPIAVAKLKQYLQILSGECDREINLVNNLLDLQRLDGGPQTANVAQVSLGTWLVELIQPFEERMGDRQQDLQFKPLTPLPAFKTDMTAVQRILAELLDNAYKYTPAGETITVTARMVDHALQLQVINSGVEIPPQHLPYIFDKFYRVPGLGHWQNGGTGLGLTFVKHLVSGLGGTVQVHSQGQKTSFRLMLPELQP